MAPSTRLQVKIRQPFSFANSRTTFSLLLSDGRTNTLQFLRDAQDNSHCPFHGQSEFTPRLDYRTIVSLMARLRCKQKPPLFPAKPAEITIRSAAAYRLRVTREPI